ncbi:MAG: hypothetical protein JWP92_2499 [Caulobacter sp.]|nr:hypothetical protein [Caulobacter sp.]
MTLKPALAASLLAVLALCAGTADAAPKKASPARQCFYANNVNGFSAVDDEHVYVRVGVKDVYAFKMFGRCPDVDWSWRLGLVSRGGGFICSGFDAELIVPSSIGTQRCPVRDIRKLTPEEVAALPPKARP